MTKIERKTQKIFAGNADTDELAVFGSMISGTPVYNDDIEALQSEAYTEGWKAAVAANEAPFMEEMNAVQYGFSKQLAYLFQQGIAEWDAGTTYYLNSFCQVGGVIYKSMQDENINHSPADDTEGTYWSPLETGGGGSSGLEVGDIGMALYVDETKGLRRWLNGQIVAINQNTQGFLTRLKQIVALYPSLLTTEENWQAAKTLSAFGQVGKFVFNYAEDEETVESVRLPAVVNVQGLLDLQNLGMTVKAGLPNIEGMVYYGHGYLANATGAFYRGNPGSLPRTTEGRVETDYNLIFDASRSNPIYGATDTVQEEAIQYPYYIQIATGQETKVNIRNDIESIVPYTLFDSKYSEAKQYNASWVLRGSTLSKSVYPTAYEAALVEYNSEIADGTTVELPSGGSYTKRGVSGGITVKLSTDETVTEYDWKLDTVAETLTVPTLNGSEDLLSDRYDDLELKASGSTYTAPANGWFWIQKLSSSTGQYLTPVIKDSNGNIKYTLTSQPTAAGYDAEILAPVSKGDVISIGYSVGGATKSFRFIYAKSNGSLYFFVASVAQNAPLANLGRIEETKVDKNSSWGFPSNRYIDLTLGASGSTYTAPANGWICVEKQANAANQYISGGEPKPGQNGSAYSERISYITSYSSLTSLAPTIFFPVRKGSTYFINYTAGGDTLIFRFIYANGSQGGS
jgi:hypothetical protein